MEVQKNGKISMKLMLEKYKTWFMVQWEPTNTAWGESANVRIMRKVPAHAIQLENGT